MAMGTLVRKLVHDPRVVVLLDTSITVVDRWREEHRSPARSAFDRMTLMKTREFANAEADKLRDLIEG
jgi:hypothetical protein